ncbi:MAG: mannose-1-phosphate guanylyltransferase/mannose-6-phosphate isomerase [Gammaproteobacteria bacterium]|nr:mannose-1-phosphate guanylyltransferase/mannose-6-phosphate isomerase [Gammaproteobacteria bacterium]|tara:strand:- start:1843 stop:3264 length:1422 start_codon:yes stop_codon:yes gene_type:complete
MLLPVVLAGGIGSRLWPVSRALLPKQFIQFPQHQGSLFQATLGRLEGLAASGEPLVICNVDHRFLVAEQLRQLGRDGDKILLEPFGRNTAPAVAMAAFLAIAEDPDTLLLVLPADHIIQNVQAFHEAVEQGVVLARDNYQVTFGIVPGAPETGYGYIERGTEIRGSAAYEVSRFVEKPDLPTAESYLASGNYSWNSGMFLFRAADYLQELQLHAEDIYSACQAAASEIEKTADFLQIPLELFKQCRAESIDYAVMEHTERAAVIPLDAGWNDLGAWDAVWDESEKDSGGNVISGDVLTQDVKNSYIQSQSRLVAAIGMDDAIIVETADAVLVANKEQAQAVKQIVDGLQQVGREESISHTLVYRPWGSYESLAMGEGYQVKHIIVNPGETLSLQLHNRRAEHWTVIKGIGQITCDDSEFELGVNESTFIPLGSKHRLANTGTTPVEIIEVQVGDYLGEDDIVRFEDRYGRIDE